MTDTQVKYQTLMENQRHNLEMERLGATEAAIKAKDAETKAYEAKTKHWQAQQQYAWGAYDRFANILPTLFGMGESLTKSASNMGSTLKNAFSAFGNLFS